jgi:signal transduction histidine kinase
MPKAAPLRRKLSLFFGAVFVVGTSLILGLTLMFLVASLRDQDIDALRAKAQDLVAVYRIGGLLDLRRDVAINDLLQGERPFLVRVATTDNRTLFASVPEQWEVFDFGIIERHRVPDPSQLTVLDNSSVNYEIEVLTVPLNSALFVQVGSSTQARMRMIDLTVTAFVLISLPVLIVVVLAVGIFTRRLLRPVGDVVALAQRAIETGTYDQSLPVRGHSREMDEMATVINRLMQMVSDLVANLRTTIDSVAHDLRTPVTRLRTKAEVTLRGEATTEELREALAGAVEESQEISGFLGRLLEVSQAESGMLSLQKERCDLGDLLREVVEVYDYLAAERDIGISLKTPESLTGEVDPGWIKQAVGNLLDNAVKYSPEGSRISVEARRESPPEGAPHPGETTPSGRAAAGGPAAPGLAVVSVRDQGPGVPQEELSGIWERQFRGTTSAGIPGHGLGLPIVRAVARAHGGTVNAEAASGGGMVFELRIPI